MNANEILNKIDHTVLSATATTEDVKKICEEAVKYGTASVYRSLMLLLQSLRTQRHMYHSILEIQTSTEPMNSFRKV